MLNLISTPIGNLNDISLRAIDVLNKADYIYAEDTRNTNKLLKFIKVDKKCRMLHEHNESEATKQIVDLLINKEIQIAVVSDAGTPAISDPGYHLVQECILNNIKFTLIPGPSSVINALVLSGLPTSSFSFLGFIPRKSKQKTDFFHSLKHEKNTMIFFESAKRLENTLEHMGASFPSSAKISICRELTKIHEEVVRGDIALLLKMVKNNELTLKGEFVVVLEGRSTEKLSLVMDKKIKEGFLNKLAAKDAAKLISLITKENKRDIYKQLLDE
ncbi:16S rRNA (cytidine(1402)-2'-O)-methyltransferase [Gammaproteobacteria bacterium]|jgi:16S rRNA (cytidine1402-2'-O)-methyltransferase|nr:16S rRNA (cytidine(1402)-2'-O)-methyltransferase [Gammaproteobacteria bacterium]MDC1424484.1 16S rRNA (cytidine(1402)-2'-O)-methyltransferase [Gammaproteobacteria bacterium]